MKLNGVGFFAEKLNDAIRQRGLSARSVAELVNCSYEHIRKLTIAEALPSSGLVSALASVFRWNVRDTRELVNWIRRGQCSVRSSGGLLVKTQE